MDTGYANEITDVQARADSSGTGDRSPLLWLGALLVFILFLAFSAVMSRRGCERIYFLKHSIPLGVNVTPYYIFSFVSEIALFTVLFALSVYVVMRIATQFIPAGIVDIRFIIIPAAALAAEILGISQCLISLKNTPSVSGNGNVQS